MASSLKPVCKHTTFKAYDKRLREIDQAWSEIWLEAADIVIAVEAGELWRDGGYHSKSDWLINACPRSRGFIHMAVAARKELTDIADEDLRQVSLGNAKVLTQLPKRARARKSVLDKAKTLTTREFIPQVTQDEPDSHIEATITISYRVSSSQAKKIRAAADLWRILNEDDDANDGQVLEAICADYMLSHQEEYAARQIISRLPDWLPKAVK